MKVSLLLCPCVLWAIAYVALSQNEPAGCQTPPALADGDIKYSMKSQYSHNERVEYMCQRYYTMKGQPYRTCINGEWTGSMRCLRPCTVNDGDMTQRNIAFKYKDLKKMYAAHNAAVEFRCTRGRPVGTATMRVNCNDGVMVLPSCQ